MRTENIKCDVCKRTLPPASKNRDDQVYSFAVVTGTKQPITGPHHPDICRKCMVEGFTVAMNESADVTFRLQPEKEAIEAEVVP